MLSFLYSKFNPINQSEFYPNPRSEGRVKSYDSCSDFRAWSLHEQDLHNYLVHVIKLNDVDPYGFISKKTFCDILNVLFGGGGGTAGGGLSDGGGPFGGGADGLGQFGLEAAGADGGQAGYGDKECGQEIMMKDEEINNLKNELGNWEMKYRELMDRLNEMGASGMDMEMAGLAESGGEGGGAVGGIMGGESGGMGRASGSVMGRQLGGAAGSITGSITGIGAAGGERTTCEDKDFLIEELRAQLAMMQQDKARLSEHNAELVKNVDQFNEHIDTLSDLKERISEYAESGQLFFGNNDKYRQLLEETLLAVLGREAICTNKELKKERKRYEDKIKEQLEKMLEMYEDAINKLKMKEEELEKKNTDLENIKLEHELMTAKCICGKDERGHGGGYGGGLDYGDEDNDSIATIEEIQISTSAPIISIEMTQNVNTLQHKSQYYRGCGREDCRALNVSHSEQRMQDPFYRNDRYGQLHGMEGVYEESVEQSLTRRHRVSARTRNPIMMGGVTDMDPNEYVVHGNPSIEMKIPFTNYTLLLKPDR